MLKEKRKLEQNKAKTDELIKAKKISFVEPISMECGMEFLAYMINEGIADILAAAEYTKERECIGNYEVFPMIYMMNTITGTGSTRKVQTILKNESAMKLIGFSDKQINEGITGRGSKNQYGD